MTKITYGTMTKKQAAALFKGEKRTEILRSDKEIYTDEEIEELKGINWFPRYPVVGSKNSNCFNAANAGLAEDDLVHSYDNNFGEYR